MARLRTRAERGDTLVEVLISIAIISLILGGAYVATTRSLTATRDAQERSDGLKLVESQVEQVKNIVATEPDDIFGSAPASYCISAGAIVTSTNNACKVNAAGAYAAGKKPEYNLSITRSGSVFTIINSWEGVLGNNTSVQMKYRLYE
ncbi:MAG TPA: prepilin-type N-terminal cleavage/methylation domain-containing protein [Candidatus Saccharimonadales bacterium]|nr:prepilin-type N-terminal cleavage/methylation domain-containing protein [Candidatus Saccharimonadales bacterium]